MPQWHPAETTSNTPGTRRASLAPLEVLGCTTTTLLLLLLLCTVLPTGLLFAVFFRRVFEAMTEEQQDRYEAFVRSRIQPRSMKKVREPLGCWLLTVVGSQAALQLAA